VLECDDGQGIATEVKAGSRISRPPSPASRPA